MERKMIVLILCWAGLTSAMIDLHGLENHEVAFVGISHAKEGKYGTDGLCVLGNSLRVNGGIHGVMYALVRKQIDQHKVSYLEGLHCTWNHVLTDVQDVESELARIVEKYQRVVVLSDNQLVVDSLDKVMACEGRCPLSGSTFVLHNATDISWPGNSNREKINYEVVWSVSHNGTDVKPGVAIVDFDVDSLWLPWHWQSGTLDGVYSTWRARALRQSPDVTVICIFLIHIIGMISVSPNPFRTEFFSPRQRESTVENMTRTERACYMFSWGIFINEEERPYTNDTLKLTFNEAILSLVFSFFHVNVFLCYFSFEWFEETASLQYDVAFSMLIIGCACWSAGIAMLCVRALGYLLTGPIHFWRFYFGFACVSCACPLTLKFLTATSFICGYSFSPSYAFAVTICLTPIWSCISSLIHLDHILSATRT